MATYAIGDIQGCFEQLQELLHRLKFDPDQDQLWFTGDLVNRGPGSLETLRFVKALGTQAITVLGNHDLHLLAVAAGYVPKHKKDTIDDILNAPDREELLEWLRQQPLIHHDTRLGYTLLHAGLPPHWDLNDAQQHAHEVETVLRGDEYHGFLEHMYGNKPNRWSDDLEGWDRLRFITNCFTRLRYCDAKGKLCLKSKGRPGSQPKPYLPWFEVPGRASRDMHIVFGHWSALGTHNVAGVYALDTGCLWGGKLTAMRLDGGNQASSPRLISIECPEIRRISEA
jgi:bis(5'-nucleosyl)-tetraphosphatase (symmetrical)